MVASLGDEILVVAFPWGQRFTVVRGVVSQIAGPPGELLVTGPARMVDASVTYGSSGGGVTTLIPASAILRFLVDSGLNGFLPR